MKIEVEIPEGLRERYPTMKALLRDVVHESSLNKDDLARQIGLPSGSRLARTLADNPYEKLFFPAESVHKLIQVTGDQRPLYWMMDQCVVTEEARRRHATERLARILPDLIAIVQAAGGGKEPKATLRDDEVPPIQEQNRPSWREMLFPRG